MTTFRIIILMYILYVRHIENRVIGYYTLSTPTPNSVCFNLCHIFAKLIVSSGMSRWSRPPTSRNTSGQSAALKKPVDVRDYFDDDEDEEYHSSSVTQTAGDGGPDDEEDPLDQFMAGVDSQVHLQQQVPCQDEASRPEVVSEQDRDYEGYFDMVDRQSRSGADAADVDYDSDGAPVGVKKADEKKPM